MDPEVNILNVSTKKPTREFLFLAKIFLKKFPTIEVQGLGEAITSAVQLAAQLERFELASIENIEQKTFESDMGQHRKKVKMIIRMRRAHDFNQKVQLK